jgi:hypothetical protein
MILVVMPPDGLVLGGDRRDTADETGVGIAVRIGAEQPLDIREQHQAVGGGHLRDARGQAVIVPVADLGRGHRIVLIDDR